MGFIASAAGQGSIGYDEYAYAIGAQFPVVALENAAGYFTMPDAYDAAVSLTQAHINYDQNPADCSEAGIPYVTLLPARDPQQRLHLQGPPHLPALVVLVRDHAYGADVQRPGHEVRPDDEHRQTPNVG